MTEISLLLFKFLSLSSFATFLYYGFDMKKRPDWKPVAQSIWTKLMKTMALSLAVALILTLLFLDRVEVLDHVALIFLALGALIVRSSKKELVKNQAFTWTGYVLEKPNLVTTGIYAYIRHPLYTGVYLVEIAGALIVFPRYGIWFPEIQNILLILSLIGLVYAMAFNAILASRESQFLRQQFGDAYTQYAKRVYAFLPISKS